MDIKGRNPINNRLSLPSTLHDEHMAFSIVIISHQTMIEQSPVRHIYLEACL